MSEAQRASQRELLEFVSELMVTLSLDPTAQAGASGASSQPRVRLVVALRSGICGVCGTALQLQHVPGSGQDVRVWRF